MAEPSESDREVPRGTPSIKPHWCRPEPRRHETGDPYLPASTGRPCAAQPKARRAVRGSRATRVVRPWRDSYAAITRDPCRARPARRHTGDGIRRQGDEVHAGNATFSATLTPTGDPVPFDDRFREGNSWHQFTGTSQPMDPSGTLQVGGFPSQFPYGNLRVAVR